MLCRDLHLKDLQICVKVKKRFIYRFKERFHKNKDGLYGEVVVHHKLDMVRPNSVTIN